MTATVEQPPGLRLSKAELTYLLARLPGVAYQPGENETLRNVRHELLSALEAIEPAARSGWLRGGLVTSRPPAGGPRSAQTAVRG